jgi:two-component system sensor histidine kinase/response regulator
VEQIADALSNGDFTLAERIAHSLKGVSANIGVAGLQSAAGALERLIHDRADAGRVDESRQQVAAQLVPLVTALRAALRQPASGSSEPSTATATATPAETRDAAGRLTALLADADPSAAGFLEANHAALRPLFDDGTWRELEALVQGYAFDDAQARLLQALDTFDVR